MDAFARFMTSHKLLLTIAFLFTAQTLFSQGYNVSGQVLDAGDNSALIGATVFVTPVTDTNNRNGTASDVNGNFIISNVTSGKYFLNVVNLGYPSGKKLITIANGDLNVGSIKMKAGTTLLKEALVKGKQIRGEQLGDTTSFNADAFKTHPDATAEDLVTKMPGVTSDNSGVKHNGETIQQVYVDGKPFFGGDDPTLALKNLPAEVIDKVQFFDKASDQSQFTGFDDGNSQKTMNIITRKNKSNGEFGKIYAGYGTDGRYLAGGSMNFFNGDRRISIIELSNNVNQQNFSSQDILGISGNSGSRGGSGGGRGFGGGGPGGGGAASNFLVGQQNGITTTHSIGLNYSDSWGKKIKITAGYFFNYTDNTNSTVLSRSYFTNKNLLYNETDQSETKNTNHRISARFEYNIDSANAIIITPKMSLQGNNATTASTDQQALMALLKSFSNNSTSANNNGYSFSNNLLIQHKFKKKGRTISLNINNSLNEKSGDGRYYSLNRFYNDTMSNYDTTLYNQYYTLYTNGYTAGANITYTEPITKKSQLMVNYNPSYTKNNSDKESYGLDAITNQYTDFIDTLSNKFTNTYITQRGGLSYRISDKKYNFNIGANVQYATLQGNQTFPYNFNLSKNFTDVLPSAMFNYRFEDGRNLRIFYRTNTTAPGITQLQDVLDISNPLLLKTGDPTLKQDYEQTAIFRYGATKGKNSHNFFVFLYANYINNYISNATYAPTKDSTVTTNDSRSISIKNGSQLSIPVNLNGYWNTRSFITYGIPLEFIKSNLNLNGGLTYTRQPALINSVLNYSNSYGPTGGVVVSSNISENVDFTLSYTGNYNIVQNTVLTQSNQNYYSHLASFKINYIFLKSFVINTNITESYYTGIAGTSSQDYYLWNAYLAYKFLKKKQLEARISVFDILNQNKAVARNLTETYLESSTTQVLKQYFMFTLTYTLRNFKGIAPDQPSKDDANNFDKMREHMGNFNRGGGPGGDH